MIRPYHTCSEPFKPYKFKDKYEIDNYLFEVDMYKDCIERFINEQNEAIRNHSNAAEKAANDWKRFVEFELSY